LAAKRITDKRITSLIASLNEVAYNLWWSWNPAAQKMFHELSPFFWEESNHNAVEVMNWISGQELKVRLQSPEFLKRVENICKTFDSYNANKSTWAQKNAPKLRSPIAYFSAELGLHESLRIYSGGLGILAGDHISACN